MVRNVAPVVVASVVLLTVGACGGSESPTSTFSAFASATRVVEAYDEAGDLRSQSFVIPSGTRSLAIRMDCVADSGDIEVRVAGFGSGAVPCDPTSQPQGHIGLGSTGSTMSGATSRIQVTAPEGARWSVAVDAQDEPVEDLSSLDEVDE